MNTSTTSAWKQLEPRATFEMLGYLPQLISHHVTYGTIAEQVARNYSHGGGYAPFGQGQWTFDPVTFALSYPDDPVMLPFYSLAVGTETAYVYPYAIVAVVQADGSFEVIRMD